MSSEPDSLLPSLIRYLLDEVSKTASSRISIEIYKVYKNSYRNLLVGCRGKTAYVPPITSFTMSGLAGTRPVTITLYNIPLYSRRDIRQVIEVVSIARIAKATKINK